MSYLDDLKKKGQQFVQNVQKAADTANNVYNAAKQGAQNVYNAATGNTQKPQAQTQQAQNTQPSMVAQPQQNQQQVDWAAEYDKAMSGGQTPTNAGGGTVQGAQLPVSNAAQSALGEGAGQWQAELDKVMSQIRGQGKFEYNMNGDAMYQQYADIYQNQANLGMQNAMAQAAALTGGYGSSYAQQVGQQAYAQQMQGLNDIGLELYDRAYAQDQAERSQLMDQYNMLAAREEQAYNRGIDERNFEYQQGRDEVADDQWDKSFDWQAEEFDKLYGAEGYYNTAREDEQTYNTEERKASQEYATATREDEQAHDLSVLGSQQTHDKSMQDDEQAYEKSIHDDLYGYTDENGEYHEGYYDRAREDEQTYNTAERVASQNYNDTVREDNQTHDEKMQNDAQTHDKDMQQNDQNWQAEEFNKLYGYTDENGKYHEGYYDRTREDEQAYNTSEREASQKYNTSEREASQKYDTEAREDSQSHSKEMQEDDQNWQAEEFNKLYGYTDENGEYHEGYYDRAREDEQTYNTAERVASQNYNDTVREDNQTHDEKMQNDAQTHQSEMATQEHDWQAEEWDKMYGENGYMTKKDKQDQENWQKEFDREGEWYADAQEAAKPTTKYEGEGALNGQEVPKQLAGVPNLTTTNTNLFDETGSLKSVSIVKTTPTGDGKDSSKDVVTYNIGGKEVELRRGYSPYTNNKNPDANNGTFNGYQPNNVASYYNGDKEAGKLSKAGFNTTINGQEVPVFTTPDGKEWVYDAANNKYLEYEYEEKKEPTKITLPTPTGGKPNVQMTTTVFR